MQHHLPSPHLTENTSKSRWHTFLTWADTPGLIYHPPARSHLYLTPNSLDLWRRSQFPVLCDPQSYKEAHWRVIVWDLSLVISPSSLSTFLYSQPWPDMLREVLPSCCPHLRMAYLWVFVTYLHGLKELSLTGSRSLQRGLWHPSPHPVPWPTKTALKSGASRYLSPQMRQALHPAPIPLGNNSFGPCSSLLTSVFGGLRLHLLVIRAVDKY